MSDTADHQSTTGQGPSEPTTSDPTPPETPAAEPAAAAASEPAATPPAAAEPARTSATAATAVAQPAAPVIVAPATENRPRQDGWFHTSLRNGLAAAVVVIVAGVFFTIGWFTSTRGDYDRPAHMIDIGQRMDMRQWDGSRFGGGSESTTPSTQQAPSSPQTPSTQQAPSTQQSPFSHGYLGVALETVTPELQTQFGLSRSDGALVMSVDRRAPAGQVGIQRGDVIINVNGTAITTAQNVVDVIGKTKAGDSASITVDRDGKSMTFQVTLADRAAGMTG